MLSSSKRELEEVYNRPYGTHRGNLWNTAILNDRQLMEQNALKQGKEMRNRYDTRSPNKKQLKRAQQTYVNNLKNDNLIEGFEPLNNLTPNKQEFQNIIKQYKVIVEDYLQYLGIIKNMANNIERVDKQMMSLPILQNANTEQQPNGMYINRFGYGQKFSSDTRHTTCDNEFIQLSQPVYNNVSLGAELSNKSPCGYEGKNVVSESNQYAWVDEKGMKHLYQSKDIYDNSKYCKQVGGDAVQISNEEFNSIPTHNQMITTNTYPCNPFLVDRNHTDNFYVSQENILNKVKQLHDDIDKYVKENKGDKKRLNKIKKNITNISKDVNKYKKEISSYKKQIDDTQRLYSKQYYTYLGWIVLTLTLGGITVHRFFK